MNDGAVHGGVAAAAAAGLTGADDAFGLAQEVPVRGHAEVAGALEEKEVWIRGLGGCFREEAAKREKTQKGSLAFRRSQRASKRPASAD